MPPACHVPHEAMQLPNHPHRLHLHGRQQAQQCMTHQLLSDLAHATTHTQHSRTDHAPAGWNSDAGRCMAAAAALAWPGSMGTSPAAYTRCSASRCGCEASSMVGMPPAAMKYNMQTIKICMLMFLCLTSVSTSRTASCVYDAGCAALQHFSQHPQMYHWPISSPKSLSGFCLRNPIMIMML